jgi:IclR family pca regulon transcriptional regulator
MAILFLETVYETNISSDGTKLAGTKLTQTMQKAVAILQVFSAGNPRMKLQEVVDQTGLPKVTAFRLLKTWISLGYVTHDSASKTYALTPRVLSLGFAALSSMSVRDAAKPYLDELSTMTSQNVNLGVIDGAYIVYIERIKRKRILNIENYVGTRLKLCETAIGKAAMAFMSEHDIELTLAEILKSPDAEKLVGVGGEKLLRELEAIRGISYAFADEELVKGLRSIAAPVLGTNGTSEGAINLPVFSMEVSRAQLLEQYLPLLLETAGRISVACGFSGQIMTTQKRPTVMKPRGTLIRGGET